MNIFARTRRFRLSSASLIRLLIFIIASISPVVTRPLANRKKRNEPKQQTVLLSFCFLDRTTFVLCIRWKRESTIERPAVFYGGVRNPAISIRLSRRVLYITLYIFYDYSSYFSFFIYIYTFERLSTFV